MVRKWIGTAFLAFGIFTAIILPGLLAQASENNNPIKNESLTSVPFDFNNEQLTTIERNPINFTVSLHKDVRTGSFLSFISNSKTSNLLLFSENSFLSSLTKAIDNNALILAMAIIVFAIILFVISILTFFFCYLSSKKRFLDKPGDSLRIAEGSAVIDDLTGLFNGNGFEVSSEKSLEECPDSTWFIIDFDINYFEHFNFLYGFECGNEILKNIAKITRETFNAPGEVCARIYADHFVCLATGNSVEDIKERLTYINNLFRGEITNDAILLSYGVYEVTDKSLPISIMQDKALVAKRIVKHNYNSFFAVYDEEIHRRQIEDSELLAYMETGIQNREFVPYYQPKFDIHTGDIVGAEALVRWEHQDGEITPPDRFIPLFEKNGTIGKLDMYILDFVCKTLRKQINKAGPVVPVSVNFSRSHLYDDGFIGNLMEILSKYKIPPRLLEIEFTESAFLDSEERLLRAIDGLHSAGFLVSIDDFGSGFSSLNLLKDLSFDIVKLDRGFLTSVMESNGRGKTVIKSVLSLAQELGLATVAEGVETKEQLEFLRENGCDIVQGFYFSPSMPEKNFYSLLKSQREKEETGSIC